MSPSVAWLWPRFLEHPNSQAPNIFHPLPVSHARGGWACIKGHVLQCKFEFHVKSPYRCRELVINTDGLQVQKKKKKTAVACKSFFLAGTEPATLRSESTGFRTESGSPFFRGYHRLMLALCSRVAVCSIQWTWKHKRNRGGRRLQEKGSKKYGNEEKL